MRKKIAVILFFLVLTDCLFADFGRFLSPLSALRDGADLTAEQEALNGGTQKNRTLDGYEILLRWTGSWFGLWKFIRAKIAEKGSVNYLDAGCGDGRALEDLKIQREGNQVNCFGVDAVDWSQQVNDPTRRWFEENFGMTKLDDIEDKIKQMFHFTQGDIGEVVIDQPMDLITCMAVMQYSKDPLKIIAHLFNEQLAKGGAFVSMMVIPRQHPELVEFYRNFILQLQKYGMEAHFGKHKLIFGGETWVSMRIHKWGNEKISLNVTPTDLGKFKIEGNADVLAIRYDAKEGKPMVVVEGDTAGYKPSLLTRLLSGSSS